MVEISYRSSRSEIFWKKVILKYFSKFLGKSLRWRLFFSLISPISPLQDQGYIIRILIHQNISWQMCPLIKHASLTNSKASEKKFWFLRTSVDKIKFTISITWYDDGVSLFILLDHKNTKSHTDMLKAKLFWKLTWRSYLTLICRFVFFIKMVSCIYSF